MGFGRLVRISNGRGDPNALIYVVAVADPKEALTIVQNKLGRAVECEDLGRVTDALLTALGLRPGEMVKT
jgi:hypothetical protein